MAPKKNAFAALAADNDTNDGESTTKSAVSNLGASKPAAPAAKGKWGAGPPAADTTDGGSTSVGSPGTAAPTERKLQQLAAGGSAGTSTAGGEGDRTETNTEAGSNAAFTTVGAGNKKTASAEADPDLAVFAQLNAKVQKGRAGTGSGVVQATPKASEFSLSDSFGPALGGPKSTGTSPKVAAPKWG